MNRLYSNRGNPGLSGAASVDRDDADRVLVKWPPPAGPYWPSFRRLLEPFGQFGHLVHRVEATADSADVSAGEQTAQVLPDRLHASTSTKFTDPVRSWMPLTESTKSAAWALRVWCTTNKLDPGTASASFLSVVPTS
jgi:hypothetical protein